MSRHNQKHEHYVSSGYKNQTRNDKKRMFIESMKSILPIIGLKELRKIINIPNMEGKLLQFKRGAAHNSCNNNYKDKVVIPVVFYNLSGYDTHFILENFANDMPGRVDLLPITKEKYISFTKNLAQNLIKFRFIDSFQFMNSALDTLASYLTEFPNLKSQFTELDKERIDLFTKKGVYPYDLVDSFDKFSFEALPDQQKFYNRLEDKNISDVQYAHAQKVWATFDCQNLGDNETSICGNGKKNCVSHAEEELLELDVNNELNRVEIGGKGTYCDCMPLCSELTYDVYQSQTEWNFNITLQNFESLLNVPWRIEKPRTSRLEIFFKTEKFWTTQRNELYGPTDLVANFGGLLGLFTGFSLLSLVEIIYFFTLRIFCNIKRYKVWIGHHERDLKQN